MDTGVNTKDSVVLCVCVCGGGSFHIMLYVGCFGGSAFYVCIEYHV